MQILQITKIIYYFKITRFKSANNEDGYILEAKLNAIAYDKNGQPKKIEDGYLRFRVR